MNSLDPYNYSVNNQPPAAPGQQQPAWNDALQKASASGLCGNPVNSGAGGGGGLVNSGQAQGSGAGKGLAAGAAGGVVNSAAGSGSTGLVSNL